MNDLAITDNVSPFLPRSSFCLDDSTGACGTVCAGMHVLRLKRILFIIIITFVHKKCN